MSGAVRTRHWQHDHHHPTEDDSTNNRHQHEFLWLTHWRNDLLLSPFLHLKYLTATLSDDVEELKSGEWLDTSRLHPSLTTHNRGELSWATSNTDEDVISPHCVFTPQSCVLRPAVYCKYFYTCFPLFWYSLIVLLTTISC